MSVQAPLLPVRGRIDSFWLDKRDSELCEKRTTADLPSKADVVIIGSGLSGAMISYFMYDAASSQNRPPPSIVMLEADETCGSATARNGGHCKPVTFVGYRGLKSKHGKEIANALMTLEESALDTYADLVEREKIECDLHITQAVDIFFNKDDTERSKQDFMERKADWPERFGAGGLQSIESPQEIERRVGVKGALWSASYPAGHLWPYLLATSLIRKSLGRGMNLQTYTSVTGIIPDNQRTIVQTPRGDISAKVVIAASNAYTASFLPEFVSKIIPVRGTACAIRPAASHSLLGEKGPLRYTYGFRHGVGDTDYLIPRQGHLVPGRGDNSIILGGAKSEFLRYHERWYNNINDNEEVAGARGYFERFMPRVFAGWNGDARNVTKVWSGVLGYSNDFKPYVGEHPARKGVFLCAGFTGHGMPQIPACARATADIATSYLANGFVSPQAQKAFERRLPLPYRMTKERFEANVNVIKEYMGQKGAAQGSIETVDEAAMLAKARL